MIEEIEDSVSSLLVKNQDYPNCQKNLVQIDDEEHEIDSHSKVKKMALGARSTKIAKLSKLENSQNEQEGSFQREFARSWDIIRGNREPQRLLEK